MEAREVRPECEWRLTHLEDRVDNIDEALSGANVDIAVLKSEVCGLVKSMDRLTKGIWGMVAAILTLIITMVITRVMGG